MGFLDNMKQLMEVKQKMEEVKQKLDSMEVVVQNDFVKVTATGNRKIKNIEILTQPEKAILESQIQYAVNEALEKSEALMQSEMMGVTKDMMPPGM